AVTLCNLGRLAVRRHDERLAVAYFSEAVPILRQLGPRLVLVNALSDLAIVRFQCGDRDAAHAALAEAQAAAAGLVEFNSERLERRRRLLHSPVSQTFRWRTARLPG